MHPAIVFCHGNVTRDPAPKQLPNGTNVAEFGVAVSRRWKVYKDHGVEDWAEEVSYFDVQCYGRLADNVLACLKKGHGIVLYGRLRQRSWEVEGAKRSKVELIAEELGMSLQFATAVVTKTGREWQAPEHPTQRQVRSRRDRDDEEAPF